MVTGIDIVKEQIRIASGDPLSIRQEDIQIHGHALECRITAETPDTFRPSSGVLSMVRFPGGPGVWVDSAIHAGAAVPPDYDPLIAKLVTCGRDRDEAIARMRRALDMTVIEGVETTISAPPAGSWRTPTFRPVVCRPTLYADCGRSRSPDHARLRTDEMASAVCHRRPGHGRVPRMDGSGAGAGLSRGRSQDAASAGPAGHESRASVLV